MLVSLLTSGSIESYVDLFYLSHRGLHPGEAPESITVLRDISRSLAEGEQFRARGDTAQLLGSLCSIGERYLLAEKAGCAIMFYTRALAMARSTGEGRVELECLHELGRCEERRGDLAASCAYHESRKALASKAGDEPAVVSAALELSKVRFQEAGEAEAKGDVRASLKLLHLALAASKQALDEQGEAKMSYAVGRAHILCKEADSAIPHLKNYVSAWSLRVYVFTRARVRATLPSATQPNPPPAPPYPYYTPPFHPLPRNQLRIVTALPALQSSQTRAYAALSAAYNLVGNDREATECLHKLLEVAQASGESQDVAQAEANENLGILAATRGDPKGAADHLQRAYTLKLALLAKGQCTRADLQRARVLVGLAKAQGLTKQFFKAVVEEDIDKLIPWKDGSVSAI